MSAVETPEAPVQETTEPRTCPRCGAPLQPGQDWCLECGEAVSTRIARAPSWKLPAAIVATVLVLGAAVLALAFLELSDDADQAAAEPTPTPVAAATPPPTPTPEASPTPIAEGEEPPAEPTPAPSTEPAESPTPAPPAGEVAAWPAGEEAWTVVLLSSTGKAEADDRAKEISEGGTPAGVLRSDDYGSLRPGYWVVFSGQYESQEEAQTAAEGMGAQAAGAYARFVDPR